MCIGHEIPLNPFHGILLIKKDKISTPSFEVAMHSYSVIIWSYVKVRIGSGAAEECNGFHSHSYLTINFKIYRIRDILPYRFIDGRRCVYGISGLILGLRPANETRRCFVTTSPIGWVQAQN